MGVIVANMDALCSHEIRLSGAPKPFFVTHGVRVEIGSPEANAIATLVRNAFVGELFAPGGAIDAGTGWTFMGTRVLWRDGTGVLRQGQNMTALAGTGTNTAPPANGAILINKFTGVAGRRFRGRMFLPFFGMAEAAVDSAGILTGPTVTAWQTRATGYHSELDTANLPIVLQHSDGAVGATVLSLVVQSLIGTQRGRLR